MRGSDTAFPSSGSMCTRRRILRERERGTSDPFITYQIGKKSFDTKNRHNDTTVYNLKDFTGGWYSGSKIKHIKASRCSMKIMSKPQDVVYK